MSISHEEAHKLIQFKADGALKEIENQLLESHLHSCQECQKYSISLSEVESTLRPVMHRKWSQAPLPLFTRTVVSRKSSNITPRILLATRIVAMGVICIAFLFNIWQFTQSGEPVPNPSAGQIPAIPTPSLQTTTAMASNQTCEPILYQIQENDTIESIASHFSVSAEDILRENRMKTTTLNTAARLTIPACSPTPSGTPNTVRTTFTPLLRSTTLTPVSGPTQ